ncbi:site-specific DNA-methyltransferase [Priestia taiwanensis]|uniref:Site-specific DNA-methyltransferase n=1 Tax=Priestia taiwanensis TaxID=1347902 RepID=A0A917AR63_9BACI|nr:site-specific DNA-methyltransferase [Priestia taiwanensis]MBM7363173.1 adenine-specific DNA-methyltransferase [Priestia taiwanensis]GGE68285.1 site-specific DNA-methyltransferase [Priestia taiwanensis]
MTKHVQQKVEQLRSLFPEAVIDGKIQVDVLKELLGEHTYDFTWKGKRDAMALAEEASGFQFVPYEEESKEYAKTNNLYIEGDNIDALKLLREKLTGKVKVIYIDPPYNTGQEFVYDDSFKEKRSVYKDDPYIHSSRLHTKWLNMMYPRLKVARDLLREDGVIFMSIDYREFANLKKISDEIFGEENFIDVFVWTKTRTAPSLSGKSRKTVEFILCYEKKRNNSRYKGEQIENGDAPLLNSGNNRNILTFPAHSVLFHVKDRLYEKGDYEKVRLIEDVCVQGGWNESPLIAEGEFKWNQQKLDEEIAKGTYFLVKSKKFSIRFQRLSAEGKTKPPTNFLSEYQYDIELNSTVGIGTNETAYKELADLQLEKVFHYPKPVSLIKYLLRFVTKNDDIVLDFFSGSGTTAHAVMLLNAEDGGKRSFIMIQQPEEVEESASAYKQGFETICEIGKERIRRAGEAVQQVTEIDNLDVGFQVWRIENSRDK